MVEDLRIQSKVYQLLQWLLPKSEKFPRFYRTTLTKRLMDAALVLHESIAAATSFTGSQRYKLLLQADSSLNIIRIYLRLISDWQWLSLSQYEHVSGIVAEIGRMLGAWIKRQKP